ncbi:ATP-binding protein [Fusobacterium russii]|uniref:ATP-binding protein n=1 Tax=Fusobacterium russii TaxID=854 RepID=UPI00039BC4EB|nr:ATP-binding protein [Fusobacterium russii]
MEKIKIGRVVEIEGINIIIEINEKEISEKINFKVGNQVTPVLINKLISIALLNGKELIGKIEKIVENNRFYTEENFKKQDNKICVFASLIGIYDYYTKKFDEGINNFPFINSEVYSISSEIKKNIMSISSEYKLKIGKSFNDNDVEIFANPDILFGKHLGIFGNTGTGKSCTVTSIIQGLKDRLTDEEGNLVKASPKIIVFDSNNEYSNAFENTELKFLKIKKKELRLPHNKLNYSEYYKLFGASQGVQVPVLKESLQKNKKIKNDNYSFKDIEVEINKIIEENSKELDRNSKIVRSNFSYNQWKNWLNPLLNRIEMLEQNEEIKLIIDYSEEIENTVEKIKNDKENNIFIIELDFDKEELDIIMFIFSKLLYNECKNENIVLVLEEAHRYINEEDIGEYKLGNYYIQKIAREGRKFGISLIVSSQRPSELSKSVVSQCNSFIIHRLTNKSDNEFVYRILSNHSKGYLNLLSGLEKQHALVCGEAFGFTDIIKIETANPTPKSEDPKMIEKWRDNVRKK